MTTKRAKSELTLTPQADLFPVVKGAEIVEESTFDAADYDSFTVDETEDESTEESQATLPPETKAIEVDVTPAQYEDDDDFDRDIKIEVSDSKDQKKDVIDAKSFPHAEPLDFKYTDVQLKSAIREAVSTEIRKIKDDKVKRNKNAGKQIKNESPAKITSVVPEFLTPQPILLKKENEIEKNRPSELKILFKEMFLIGRDSASSAVSLFLFPCFMVWDLFITALSIAFIAFRPRKRSVVKLLSALSKIWKGLKTIFAPAIDHRKWIYLSFILLAVGASLSFYPHKIQGISFSVFATALGISIFFVSSILRLTHAVSRGQSSQKIPKRWLIDWINTESLSGQEIKGLNDGFESVVAELFVQLGFKTKLNGTQQARLNGHQGSGDGGIDIFLVDSTGVQSLVSCKRYSSPVGVKEVRDIFAVSQSADFSPSRPVLVTTIGFTEAATIFAKKNGVLLVVYKDLLNTAVGYRV